MSSAGEGADNKVVCVTGASGYIASWLVKLLVTPLRLLFVTLVNDPRKTEHLHQLPGAKERLHLYKANLLDKGSFDSIVDGCDGVFHTASPCFFETKDPQAELVDPAVNGTLNVLGSCAKTPSVRRVIVTSSTAAVYFNGKPRTPEAVVDETWFSDAKIVKELKLWYALSKTLAEESAWKFAKDHGVDMVIINPSMVIGPLLQPTLNISAATILNFINGAQTYNNITFGWVNVKDVANAHILAFEVPSASGRYCVAESVAHYSEVLKVLHELYPDIELPQKCVDDKPFVPTFRISQEKIKSLGVEFTPMEVGLKETVESLKEKGFISF